MNISSQNTLSDNLTLALQPANVLPDGFIKPEVVRELLKVTSERGWSKDELTQAERIVAHLKDSGSPNVSIAAMLLHSITAGQCGQGTIAELLGAIDDRLRTGKLPSLAWQDRVPTREQLHDWRTRIGQIQQTLVEGNENLHAIDRAFHQKQLYAGLATVKIREGIPKFLQFGPFANDADGNPPTLSAVVRFSNGRGCPYADKNPDVRGIAVKFLDRDGNPWDVLATSKQTFARDPEQFMKFAEADAIAQTVGDQTKPLLGTIVGTAAELGHVGHEILKGHFDAGETARIAGALFRDTVLHKTKSLATESYDGGTFKTPDGYLAKIIFTPVGDVRPMDSDSGDPNYLNHEMQQQLLHGAVRFTMSVKVYTGNGDPNDATDRWEPSMVVPVVDLDIPYLGERMSAGELKELQEAISRMAFNPATGFTPAGMSHARHDIYDESAKRRGAMSQAEAATVIKRYSNEQRA